MIFSLDGNYLFLKRLLISENNDISGETLILNMNTGKLIFEKSPHFFMNFTRSPEGNSILIEENPGIFEFFPDSRIKKLICAKSQYSDTLISDNPAFLYLSPNRKRMLIVNGSGGFYKGKIFSKFNDLWITDLTSSAEITWLSNSLIAYRTGYTGNYSIKLLDTKTNQIKTLITNSLNTSMNYSSHSGIISFLKNQLIHIYKISENKLVSTGIEGEDISFSPDGNRFISLLYKKLFITKYNLLEKRNLQHRNSLKKILELYKILLKNNQVWLNEYTLSYINRKIDDYRILIGE